MTLILDVVKFPVPFIFPTAIPSGGTGEGRKARKLDRIFLFLELQNGRDHCARAQNKRAGELHRNSTTPVVSPPGTGEREAGGEQNSGPCSGISSPCSQEFFIV